MSDSVEIKERMKRLILRVAQRDDYGKLLAAGQVVRQLDDLEDPDEWQEDIHRSARADRIELLTGKTESTVWALLTEAGNASRSAESRRYKELLSQVVPRAEDHRHEPAVAARDGDEAVFICDRCEALGYADAASGPLIGGELFEEDCSGDEPPKDTALTWLAGKPRR